MRLLFCSGMPISLSSEIKGGGNWIVQHIKALMNKADRDIQIGIVCLDPVTKELKNYKIDGVLRSTIKCNKKELVG